MFAALLLAVSNPVAQAAMDLYSPDPGHLWNRVHDQLMVRTVAGVVVDDPLDPPFRMGEGRASPEQAVALLREFSADRKALAAMGPLRRALMQRDLLALFHSTMARNPTPETQPLVEPLAKAIRHVALSAGEIAALPDNYDAASALPGAFTAFDAREPDRAFLPKGLLADDGAWLALEAGPNRPVAAPLHSFVFQGRSSFELRFRHPGGRKAGEAYLAELAAMPQPLVTENPKVPFEIIGRDNRNGPWLNPATPQFPVGTMWALVRRAILVDTQGNLVVSPLVESVQVRVYREVEFTEISPVRQAYFEWELSRRKLLSGSGFHQTEGRDLAYSQFLAGLGVGGPGDPTTPAATLCFSCHHAPGIFSVNSRSFPFSAGLPNPSALPPVFRVSSAKSISEASLKAAKQPGWEKLKSLEKRE